MAGTIIADTLTHSTAGSVTTDYVVNGSAKAWVNFNGTGTIATRDSLNVSGLTDSSTGEYSVNLSSAMNNSNYAFYGSASKAAGGISSTNSAILLLKEAGNYTTTAVAIGVCDSAGTAKDFDTVTSSVNGDLA
jgi:hypothetical protein